MITVPERHRRIDRQTTYCGITKAARGVEELVIVGLHSSAYNSYIGLDVGQVEYYTGWPKKWHHFFVCLKFIKY